jgi:hypothetical protein
LAYAEIAFRERMLFPEAFCPPELDYVWEWFTQDFWPNYASNGFGIQSFSYVEIAEWAKLMNIKLTRIEIRTIKKLDTLFVEAMSKKSTPATPGVKSEVEAANVDGVRALLAGFNANAKSRQEMEKAKLENGGSGSGPQG